MHEAATGHPVEFGDARRRARASFVPPASPSSGKIRPLARTDAWRPDRPWDWRSQSPRRWCSTPPQASHLPFQRLHRAAALAREGGLALRHQPYLRRCGRSGAQIGQDLVADQRRRPTSSTAKLSPIRVTASPRFTGIGHLRHVDGDQVHGDRAGEGAGGGRHEGHAGKKGLATMALGARGARIAVHDPTEIVAMRRRSRAVQRPGSADGLVRLDPAQPMTWPRARRRRIGLVIGVGRPLQGHSPGCTRSKCGFWAR